MTGSLQLTARLTAPSTAPSTPVPGAGAARISQRDQDRPEDSHEDFHSVMERHAAEKSDSHRAVSSKPKSAVASKPAQSTKNDSAKNDPAKNTDSAATSANTADSATPEPAAIPKPAPHGPIELSASTVKDASSDDQDNTAGALLTASDGAANAISAALQSGAAAAPSLPRVPGGRGLRSNPGSTSEPAATVTATLSGLPGMNLSALATALDSQKSGTADNQSSTANTPGSVQADSAADSKLDSPEKIEVTSSGAANASDALAFEAKLTVAPGSTAAGNALQQTSQLSEQLNSKGSALAGASTSAVETATEAAPSIKPQQLFETGTVPAAAPAAAASHSSTPGVAQPAPESAVDRMQPMIEAPALASSRHNITVKVAGETSATNIDLRFVDRGGEIHLSVRTPSTEVAQELRGGLSDLAGKLEHAGIRAEISSPSANGSNLSDSSKDPGAEQDRGASDGRGSGRDSQSQTRDEAESRQQDSPASNRSRWIEVLEGSNNFSKEQNI